MRIKTCNRIIFLCSYVCLNMSFTCVNGYLKKRNSYKILRFLMLQNLMVLRCDGLNLQLHNEFNCEFHISKTKTKIIFTENITCHPFYDKIIIYH